MTKWAKSGCDDDPASVNTPAAFAAPEPSLLFLGPATVSWAGQEGALLYHLYRGDMAALHSTGVYVQDPVRVPAAAQFCGLTATQHNDGHLPAPGELVFYLVTSDNGTMEASLGLDSQGNLRPNDDPCH